MDIQNDVCRHSSKVKHAIATVNVKTQRTNVRLENAMQTFRIVVRDLECELASGALLHSSVFREKDKMRFVLWILFSVLSIRLKISPESKQQWGLIALYLLI